MIDSIVRHLRGTLSPADHPAVVMAEDIDAVAERIGLIDSGSVVVMPFRERAEPQALATGGFRQRIAVQVLTVIVLREYDEAMGGSRAARFDRLKRQVEAALAGWTPDSAITPCELVDGESSPFDRGVSFYLHTWQTARFLKGS